MDRALRKGPIGRCMAWLQARATTPEEHRQLKVALSSEAAFQGRSDGRDAFAAIAQREGGTYEDILEEERRVRGGAQDEPAVVAAR